MPLIVTAQYFPIKFKVLLKAVANSTHGDDGPSCIHISAYPCEVITLDGEATREEQGHITGIQRFQSRQYIPVRCFQKGNVHLVIRFQIFPKYFQRRVRLILEGAGDKHDT